MSKFLASLEVNQKRMSFALESYAKAGGAKMVKYAKQNAPWENRTRAARDGIAYKTEWETATRLRLNLTRSTRWKPT